MKKEKKTERLELRLSTHEKQQFRDYAKKHNISMSETILILCQRAFALENEEETK